jgi:hypothetical protein
LSVVVSTVEHVIDDRAPRPEGAGSRIELLLEQVLAAGPVLFYEPTTAHGRRPGVELPQAPAFARLLETGASHLEVAKAAYAEQCRQAAVQARALAAFARARPAGVLDRPDDEVGAAAASSRAARPAALTAVSEWAVDEVMLALNLSSSAATTLLSESVILVDQLPATLEALEQARIGPSHARMLTEVLTPLHEEKRAEVEARLLARADGQTVGELKAAARRAVLRADVAAAARRAAGAIRDRAVRAHPGEDGMGTLAATMPIPVLAACREALRQYAEDCQTPDDERPVEARMLDCLVDLILRPGETGLPPAKVQLTVVAATNTLAGGDEPGEVDGQPVPAIMVRELAYTLGLLPRPEDAEPTPEVDSAVTEDAEPAVAAEGAVPAVFIDRVEATRRAVSQLGELLALRDLTGTALATLPQIAVVEEISGQLLALTDATGLRRAATTGCGLGPPPDTPGYRPSTPLGRFVRARDRRCRFPGCRAPAIGCDLDHTTPWPCGPTSATNLCCLCRHHHRLSHQAPGWTMRILRDGGLQWTSPSGHTVTTHPPAYGTDDHPPPTAPSPPPRPVDIRESIIGSPSPTGDCDAPF